MNRKTRGGMGVLGGQVHGIGMKAMPAPKLQRKIRHSPKGRGGKR